jgi:hypothetical protein
MAKKGLESRVEKLEFAIFGDSEDPGMKRQLDDIHDLLIGANFTWKFLRWIVPVILLAVVWFSPVRDAIIKLFYN